MTIAAGFHRNKRDEALQGLHVLCKISTPISMLKLSSKQRPDSPGPRVRVSDTNQWT